MAGFTVKHWQSRMAPKEPDGSMKVGFRFEVAGPQGLHPLSADFVFPTGRIDRIETDRMVPIPAAGAARVELIATIGNVTPGEYAIRLTIADNPLGDFSFAVSE